MYLRMHIAIVGFYYDVGIMLCPLQKVSNKTHNQYLWPDLTKAGFDAHSKHAHFSPPIDGFIHQLTIDGYFTVHSSSVCFSRGLFLWPVWRPRVHGYSLNGPGAGWQVANWLKTSSKVDRNVRNGFSSILWGLQLKMTLGIAYLAVHVTDKNFVPPSTPT